MFNLAHGHEEHQSRIRIKIQIWGCVDPNSKIRIS